MHHCPSARAAARGWIKHQSALAMSRRRHRHVRASRGEWVHVHRGRGSGRSPDDPPWWAWLLAIVGGVVAISWLVEVVVKILAAIFPWLIGIAIVGAVVWGVGRFISQRS